MSYLHSAWETVLELLSQPWLQGLAALVAIVGAIYKYRRLLGRLTNAVVSWAGTRFRRGVKWACRKLEIATLDDLDARPAAVQSGGSATASSVPRHIERFGVRIDLAPDITDYLGQYDPSTATSHMVSTVLQGPFCRKCSYTLVKWNNRIGVDEVVSRCPQCGLQVHGGASIVRSDAFKNDIYKRLDAEFRATGRVAPTDKNPSKEVGLAPPAPQ